VGRRTNENQRRRLGLERETLRQLGARDLGQVAGGSRIGTDDCAEHWSMECADSQVGTGSRFC